MTIKCSVYCGAGLDGFLTRPDGDSGWCYRFEYGNLGRDDG